MTFCLLTSAAEPSVRDLEKCRDREVITVMQAMVTETLHTTCRANRQTSADYNSISTSVACGDVELSVHCLKGTSHGRWEVDHVAFTQVGPNNQLVPMPRPKVQALFKAALPKLEATLGVKCALAKDQMNQTDVTRFSCLSTAPKTNIDLKVFNLNDRSPHPVSETLLFHWRRE
jgi:hypothetical protein